VTENSPVTPSFPNGSKWLRKKDGKVDPEEGEIEEAVGE
jgi:hypothetical protein